MLALVAVVAVEAMPQAVEGNSLTPSAAVPQTPGMILTAAQGTIPTQLVQIASPLFQGAPATAGPGPAAPQLFSLTPIMVSFGWVGLAWVWLRGLGWGGVV